MVIISIETLQSFTCGFMFSQTTPFVLSRLIRQFYLIIRKGKNPHQKWKYSETKHIAGRLKTFQMVLTAP